MKDKLKQIRELLEKAIIKGTDRPSKDPPHSRVELDKDLYNQALSLLPKPCSECGGSGEKPREKHCSLNMCIKTHERITCYPGGIKCEYYIPTKPCPACKGEVEINKIKTALSDPKAPWYGSDLVSWVADLLEAYEALLPPVCSECGGSGEVPNPEYYGRGKEIYHSEYIPCPCQAPAGVIEELIERIMIKVSSNCSYCSVSPHFETCQKSTCLPKLTEQACDFLTAQAKEIKGLETKLKEKKDGSRN